MARKTPTPAVPSTAQGSLAAFQALNAILEKLASLEQSIVAQRGTQEPHTPDAPTVSAVVSRPALPVLTLSGISPEKSGSLLTYRFARDTQLLVNEHSGFVSGSALCADGTVRRLTWTAKPKPNAPVASAVRVGQRTVSGYLLLEPAHRAGDPPALKFYVNPGGKHAAALPLGTFHGRRTEDHEPSAELTMA